MIRPWPWKPRRVGSLLPSMNGLKTPAQARLNILSYEGLAIMRPLRKPTNGTLLRAPMRFRFLASSWNIPPGSLSVCGEQRFDLLTRLLTDTQEPLDDA